MRFKHALVMLMLAACGGDDGKTVTEQVCLGSSTQCGDTCVNTASDNDNCGACGNACGTGQVCDNGACAAAACPTGQMMCGDACKDTQVDTNNCGACGNECSVGETCDGGMCELAMWELLEPMDNTIMWTGYVSSGDTVAYGLANSSLYKYTLPTVAEPLGSYDTTSMAPPTSFGTYSTPTRSGDALYVIEDSTLYKYDITGNTWTTPITDLASAVSNAQLDHDDDGNLYVWSGDQSVVVVHLAGPTVDVVAGPDAIPTSEPRGAWDSASHKFYIADYEDSTGTFYSFDPANQMFEPLASLPNHDGFGDAFCADRAGHIFATSSGDTDTSDVWVYDVASNTWSQLPNLPIIHGSSPSCFYADGYLYVSNGDQYALARLAL